MKQTVTVGAETCPTIAFPPEYADIAIAWLKTLLGFLEPDQFLKIVEQLAPQHIEHAVFMLNRCLGAGI